MAVAEIKSVDYENLKRVSGRKVHDSREMREVRLFRGTAGLWVVS